MPTFFAYASGESIIYEYDDESAFCELDDPSDSGVNFMTTADMDSITNCGFSVLPTLVTEDTLQAAMWAFDVGQPRLSGGSKENRLVMGNGFKPLSLLLFVLYLSIYPSFP